VAKGFDLSENTSKFFLMKFDVEIPDLDGVARLEIRNAREQDGWSCYIGFVAGQSAHPTCLLLGKSGVPYRFTGLTQSEAQERAKEFLQKTYRVVRIVW
jgi:hypothetical protein